MSYTLDLQTKYRKHVTNMEEELRELERKYISEIDQIVTKYKSKFANIKKQTLTKYQSNHIKPEERRKQPQSSKPPQPPQPNNLLQSSEFTPVHVQRIRSSLNKGNELFRHRKLKTNPTEDNTLLLPHSSREYAFNDSVLTQHIHEQQAQQHEQENEDDDLDAPVWKKDTSSLTSSSKLIDNVSLISMQSSIPLRNIDDDLHSVHSSVFCSTQNLSVSKSVQFQHSHAIHQRQLVLNRLKRKRKYEMLYKKTVNGNKENKENKENTKLVSMSSANIRKELRRIKTRARPPPKKKCTRKQLSEISNNYLSSSVASTDGFKKSYLPPFLTNKNRKIFDSGSEDELELSLLQDPKTKKRRLHKTYNY